MSSRDCNAFTDDEIDNMSDADLGRVLVDMEIDCFMSNLSAEQIAWLRDENIDFRFGYVGAFSRDTDQHILFRYPEDLVIFKLKFGG